MLELIFVTEFFLSIYNAQKIKIKTLTCFFQKKNILMILNKYLNFIFIFQ